MQQDATHQAAEGISIHLAPEVIGHLGDLPLTNTLLTVWLTIAVLVGLAFLVRRRLALVPDRVQMLAELVVGGAYDYVEKVLASEALARRFFPIIATLFLLILGANWLGLLPGIDSVGLWSSHGGEEKLVPFFHPANTDLNVTLALAIIAFLTVEFAGVAALGALKYAGKFVNFKSPLAFLIGIIELFSELARLVSFSFRLFGNIFAGKTLIVVAIFFVPYLVPVPLLAFELFVGLIQAFIFSVLTLFFIRLAVEEPHGGEEAHGAHP